MNGTHEEVKDLIGPYVLGAVPEEEVPMIRSHILSCEECMQEAENYSGVTSSLALAVDPVPLPAGFAERTMARIADERPSPSTAPARSRKWSLGWALSSAALVVIIAILSLAFSQSRSQVSTNEQIVAALLEEDGVSLQGSGVGRLVATEDGTKFVAKGLEPAPEGNVYQLWKMSESCAEGAADCTIKSGGTFEVQDGLVVVDVEGGLSEFEEAAVTIEKTEESQPTGDPVMASF